MKTVNMAQYVMVILSMIVVNLKVSDEKVKF